MAEKTFYEILELRPDAAPEEVHAAHERIAARPAEKARLDAISEAFATLSDPLKRAKYDMSLEVREKPASEQIQAIEPMWTTRALVVLLVFVALAGVAYYLYEENEAREEAARAAAAAAAEKEKAEEARIKAAADEASRQAESRLSVNERAQRELDRLARERRRDEAQQAAAAKRKPVKLTKEEIELMKKYKGKIATMPSMPPGISIEMK